MNAGGFSSLMEDALRLMEEIGAIPDEATIEEELGRLLTRFSSSDPGFPLVLRAAFRAGWEARHLHAWRREILRGAGASESTNKRAEQ